MGDAPKILFVHRNFPAQFGAIGTWLAQQGWDVTFATARDGAKGPFRVVPFKDHREVTKGIHPYLAGTEAAVITAQGFARTAIAMAAKGYVPDIVVGHSGWGVGTFARDVWERTKFVPYVEWFYQWPAVDASPDDPPVEDPVDRRARTRVRNTPMLLDLMAGDAILCPTSFQTAQFPEIWRDRITVLHDGVDTKMNAPGPRDADFLASHSVPPDAEIVTYVARGMEPQRGFPDAMRAISALMSRRPNLHAIVVGEDRVAYGNKSVVPSWKDKMLADLPFDADRLHFTGLISRADLAKVYRASDAHLYLSVPFVLSWSALEAMSAGAHLIAADNAPVQEFMAHSQTASLVDPQSTSATVAAVEAALDDRQGSAEIKAAARAQTVLTLDAESVMWPARKAFFEGVIAAERKT